MPAGIAIHQNTGNTKTRWSAAASRRCRALASSRMGPPVRQARNSSALITGSILRREVGDVDAVAGGQEATPHRVERGGGQAALVRHILVRLRAVGVVENDENVHDSLSLGWADAGADARAAGCHANSFT